LKSEIKNIEIDTNQDVTTKKKPKKTGIEKSYLMKETINC